MAQKSKYIFLFFLIEAQLTIEFICNLERKRYAYRDFRR